MSKIVSGLLATLLFFGLLSGCTSISEARESSTDLSALSDDELYETVYFQTIALVDSYFSDSIALESIQPAQRTFYVLSMYDMEIQNGGLCQFFVNPSRSLEPYVEECLQTVGAGEHKELFTGFIEENEIDVFELDSFIISDIAEFIAQTERFDFDAFDNSYYELPALYTQLIDYIRFNIDQF